MFENDPSEINKTECNLVPCNNASEFQIKNFSIGNNIELSNVNESVVNLYVSKEMEINNETEQLHSMDSEKQIIMKDTKDLSVIDYAEKITCCGNWNNERFLKGCKWSPDEIGNRVLVLDGDNKLKIFHCFLNKIDYNKSQISSDNYELSCIGNIYDYDWYPLIEPSQYYIIVASSLGPVHIYDMTISKSISSYQMYNTNDEAIYAHCVTCSPDGMTVLSGTTDYIFIFDTNRPGKMFNRILTRPYFKRGIISSISINPMRNSMFAVGSYNSRIGIYDETKLLCMLYGHAKGVTQLKFSNNGLFLYSGVRGSSEIICWDLRNPGTALFRLDRVVKTQQRIYFDITPDSRYVFSGNTNGYVYIWDTLLPPKGQVLPFFHKFQAHSDCTNGISIHKQLPFFATVSGQYHNPVFLLDSDNDDKEDDNQIFICEEENSLKLWHMNRN